MTVSLTIYVSNNCSCLFLFVLFLFLLFILENLERRPNTSSEDNNFSHPEDNEPPGVRRRSSSSLIQLTSGDSRKTSVRQAQREDMVPLVRYEGVVEDTHAANVRAHREVKVIVHKTSSSSSSTVSSVRSVEQRIPTSRGKQVRSRDHFHHCHQNRRERREIKNLDQSPSDFTVEKRSSYGEESIQLQVIGFAKDETNSEASQETIKEGGSLAAMFDS